eukprot:4300100-Prymnesium_polylepis.1
MAHVWPCSDLDTSRCGCTNAPDYRSPAMLSSDGGLRWWSPEPAAESAALARRCCAASSSRGAPSDESVGASLCAASHNSHIQSTRSYASSAARMPTAPWVPTALHQPTALLTTHTKSTTESARPDGWCVSPSHAESSCCRPNTSSHPTTLSVTRWKKAAVVAE